MQVMFQLTSFQLISLYQTLMPSVLETKNEYLTVLCRMSFLPEAIPPRIVATIGVCKRGWIHEINRKIKPSAAIA